MVINVCFYEENKMHESGAYPDKRTYACAYTRSEKVNLYNVQICNIIWKRKAVDLYAYFQTVSALCLNMYAWDIKVELRYIIIKQIQMFIDATLWFLGRSIRSRHWLI